MNKLFSLYSPKLAHSLVYMLQATEYDVGEYLAWFWRAGDLRRVAKRKSLDLTPKARLLLALGYGLIALEGLAVIISAWYAAGHPASAVIPFALLAAAPFITVYGLAAVLWAGELAIQRPRERKIIARASAALEGHAGLRIAIAGSYGKTTMKEILLAVLSGAMDVAATPGNMNTPLGISRFIGTLKGSEQVVIFELGEYYPGDIAELCALVKPRMGVITGINEAHLSKFKTLDRTAATIFELADYLGGQPVYKNGENALVLAKITAPDPLAYASGGVAGWTVTNIQLEVDGTAFVVRKGDVEITAKSGLLGQHVIGPLVVAVDIAHNLGLSADQISAGIAATKPYEHRMQPRRLAGGWVIDDTYNGNSDGVSAGLAWLAAVDAKRRIYVTPGLVEQGSKTAEVHRAIGRQIAAVADVAVLMQNSATAYIQEGLKAANYAGELQIIPDPLRFYSNLDQFVAAGDVVLMQNDWTDNYL